MKRQLQVQAMCELSARRRFLGSIVAAGAVYVLGSRRSTSHSAPGEGLVEIENIADDGRSLGVVKIAPVVKTEQEWRKQLSPLAYHVTRESGTEYAFSGEYDHTTAPGLYRCICCGTALFDSRTKYDSGTGWPSFWKPISSHNVAQVSGHKWVLWDAVSCRLCDAHLGHVFSDGPKPTGLRYCMNSVSLHFIPRKS